ncbi:MAG: hypothetical protein CL454_00890 [Acidimicrobiaceae bacterium]|nr:hypothetical protein [Acidimicrobiaceae bacterium]
MSSAVLHISENTLAEARYSTLMEQYFAQKQQLDILWKEVEAARREMQANCDHDWEREAEWGGRTVRTCRKCGK